VGLEQREYARLKEEFPVVFAFVPSTLLRPLAKPKRKGIVKNISGGGLYMLIASRMHRGMVKKLLAHSFKISVEFYLPDFQYKVNALADVQWIKEKMHWWQIWSKQWSLGIKFTYMQPADRDYIIKYIINKQIESNLLEPDK